MKVPRVLFCDNHLLVLDKPPGLLTQPSPQEEESLETWGKEWLKSTFHKPGNVFLHAVHRLDRPASGIVLFARTSKALSRLQEAVRQGSASKAYLAIVEGRPEKDAGVFEDWLLHQDYHAESAGPGEKHAKRAELKYRVINEKKPYTLVQVLLKTGRYHQIRMQFSKRNFPIVGDRKYGSESIPFSPHAIALHHFFFEITHPVEKIQMAWHSLPPPDWPLVPPPSFSLVWDGTLPS